MLFAICFAVSAVSEKQSIFVTFGRFIWNRDAKTYKNRQWLSNYSENIEDRFFETQCMLSQC